MRLLLYQSLYIFSKYFFCKIHSRQNLFVAKFICDKIYFVFLTYRRFFARIKEVTEKFMFSERQFL